MGIDEAGRGPLAGPVVAAAAIIPTDIPGITDSKKITKEDTREELYEEIVSSPNARWAVAIGDAARVDEVNILQATLECMRNAARGLMELEQFKLGSMCIVPASESGSTSTDLMRTPADKNDSDNDKDVKIAKVYPREKEYSSKIHGCYIVCGINDANGKPMDINGNTNISDDLKSHDLDEETTRTTQSYYALVDGNRLPKEMPCDAEPIIKGDSKEYAIAAASILAKVTRDRLMHEYDALYPEFNLKQHKGYPTAAHMSKVREFGASPIHRRTFAPLKHMSFDDDGRIIVSSMENNNDS
jgi:ribonuclease HII